jgi:hypothetical protein
MNETTILETVKSNNGYGCSCCSTEWSGHEWIGPQSLLDSKGLIAEMERELPLNDFRMIEKIYEKSGKTLYGWTSTLYKSSEDQFLVLGSRKVMIKAHGSGKAATNEEIESIKAGIDSLHAELTTNSFNPGEIPQ